MPLIKDKQILFHTLKKKSLKLLRLIQVPIIQHLNICARLACFEVWNLPLLSKQIFRVKNVQKYLHWRTLVRLLKIAGSRVMRSPPLITQFSMQKQVRPCLQSLVRLGKIVSYLPWSSHLLLTRFQHSSLTKQTCLLQNLLLV
jgi:hypothetical protein